MDIRKIKKLIELLEESGIAEIEIKEGEEALRISRMPAGTATGHQAAQVHVAALPAGAVGAAATASAALPAAESAAPKPKPNEHVITAPMVGTFYGSPSPGAKAFVEIGDEIKVGQVLCIIEAMKMMNQIEADRAGRITSVMAQNGDPVEFGQPLFVVE
ncbi:MAG: acetyl-CoA carboxylase biotin carboxyl carrier protein [Gammaproteobacteria bacterium]|nr:MAG: acetyl-CoA carboxylase biotin carboxyl carrier protein [Gammaproteobacteria bacterium]TLZ22984.1 MAG: acetyl-CoA carboxylase biotin carboxyl carrier protein [Gammaproteobacteria bacterium]TLZ49674.1 MAG: acetyl-CoA carboxylase biotin carboxyl carrier protein [Gammaproteobacteria bacterium]